jgi:5-(carboxyamino)imidazole ribonucleotide synthase
LSDTTTSTRRPVVGIIGGGQLARMSLAVAHRLDLDVRILASSADDPAMTAGGRGMIGDIDDLATLTAFAAQVDVVTFEHELVPAAALAALAARGVCLRPAPSAFALIDKATQRRWMADHGVAVPPFAIGTTGEDDVAVIEQFAADHGWPVVVKLSRGGFDGRGTVLLEQAGPLPFPFGSTFVVEPFLPLERELAVLVARRPGGDDVLYPVVETHQVDGMCREVVAPAPVPDRLASEAAHIARTIAAEADVVGLLAVEFFVADGSLSVNELAMRPHNSGHYSIEACETSQFENHLRAVLDWPLGSTRLHSPAAMVNVVGIDTTNDPRDHLAAALAAGSAAVHLYGKTPRRERKLGHVTALRPEPAAALAAARAVAAALSP